MMRLLIIGKYILLKKKRSLIRRVLKLIIRRKRGEIDDYFNVLISLIIHISWLF